MWERRTHTTGSVPRGQPGWKSYGPAATRKKFRLHRSPTHQLEADEQCLPDDASDAGTLLTVDTRPESLVEIDVESLVSTGSLDPLKVEVTTAKEVTLINTVSSELLVKLGEARNGYEGKLAEACQHRLAELVGSMYSATGEVSKKDLKFCIATCTQLVVRFWRTVFQCMRQTCIVTGKATSSRSLDGAVKHVKHALAAALVKLEQLIDNELHQHTSKLHRHVRDEFQQEATGGLFAQAGFIFKTVSDIVPQQILIDSKIKEVVQIEMRATGSERDEVRRGQQPRDQRHRESSGSPENRDREQQVGASSMVQREQQRIENKRIVERKGGRKHAITDRGRDGRGWTRKHNGVVV